MIYGFGLFVGLALFCGVAPASTFTVTKTADTNDGTCDSDCSLREAVAAADAAESDDIIEFDAGIFSVDQTITLGGTQIQVTGNGNLVINGPDLSYLAISGDQQSGVILINEGASVTIKRLTITNGFTQNRGGGIHNLGSLQIFDSIVEDNRTIFIGGGIHSSPTSSLTVVRTTIRNNIVTDRDGGGISSSGVTRISSSVIENNEGRYGGGIVAQGGTINIEGSTITNNEAFSGGGISNFNGNAQLNIRDTTIHSNTSLEKGGGIQNNTGILNLTNTTISSNKTTVSSGGGIYVRTSTVNLVNVTVAFNDSPTLLGGGVFNETGGVVNVGNSVIAQNTAAVNGSDFRGVLTSQGFNLIGDTSDSTIEGVITGNQLDVDPLLGALSHNGGFSLTHPLLSGSPAIDAADPNSFPVTDQRGAARALDGDSNATDLPDVGAFEVGALIVTKTADTDDGKCDSDCSLREAIDVANNSAANDAIIFSSLFNSPQTIILGGNELSIANNGDLTITGQDAEILTVSGNVASRVFFVENEATATISRLKVTKGNGDGGNAGGGIFISQNASLTVNDSIIEDNGPYATGLTNEGGGVWGSNNSVFNLNNSIIQDNVVRIGGAGFSTFGTANVNDSIIRNNMAFDNGGGIRAAGDVTIANSTIVDNQVTIRSGGGGGIYNIGGNSVMVISDSVISGNSSNDRGGGITNALDATITIERSTVSDNLSDVSSPGANPGGGGLFNDGGIVTVIDSDISDNTTIGQDNREYGGGGIYNFSGGLLTLTNVTISNNRADAGSGGGIYNRSGPANFTNVTVVENHADAEFNIDGNGAGIYNRFDSPINVRNSIIANNIDASDLAPDVRGSFISQGHNIIESAVGGTITGDTTGNIMGRDPLLMPRGNYGGPTKTHSLNPGSPAIDNADPNNFPVTDQRGITRAQDGDLDDISLPDIGAYERQLTTFTVTDPTDSNDGSCNSDCSLREAIEAAQNAASTDNAVVFDGSVFSTPMTLNLTQGELVLGNNGNLIIDGSAAEMLTISGNNQSRILYLNPGANAALKRLTISGGNGSGAVQGGFGGAILNDGGFLGLLDAVVESNTSTQSGGAVYNDNSGIFVIDSSTIRNNSSGGNGGGVYLNDGQGDFFNSTFNGNSSNSGGGVYSRGVLNIFGSTVNGNSALFGGGGLVNTSSLTVVNSTISENSIDGAFGGGGIFNDSTGTTDVFLSTIAFNIGSNGGGLRNNGGTLNVSNTIISNNTDNGGAAPDFSGVLTSGGYNLIKDITGTSIKGVVTGNQIGVDPSLSELGDYGGATRTHRLSDSSPAVDAGNSSLFTIDQRGFTRPFDNPFIPNSVGQGNGSDIGAVELQESESNTSRPARFDLDGDSKTDIGIFRPGPGEWWYLRSSDGGNSAVQFGQSSDTLTPADYTGDGRTDIAFWRESTGEWFVLRSEDQSFFSFPFGTAGDIPAPGDFDGDGKADPAVFRPATGEWFVLRSSDGGVTIQTFGTAGDKPTVEDFDGDGKADLAIYRPSVSEWWQLRSTEGIVVVQFGSSGDMTVPADYTGDGKADIAFWRPSNGFWFVLRSEDNSFFSFPFGTDGDVPAPGDYDGDGTADPTVFRTSTNVWFINGSTSGVQILGFGAAGDVPIPSAYVTQ